VGEKPFLQIALLRLRRERQEIAVVGVLQDPVRGQTGISEASSESS
jgi:hypothetical protein